MQGQFRGTVGRIMASEANSQSPQNGGGQRQPLSPAARKRLQQCFEHASKQAAQDNFDYATELFTQCVLGDPGNVIYLQSFLGNLQKKYNNNKKGSKLALIRAAGPRTNVKKDRLQKHWDALLRHGIEVLKYNPWDVSTLSAMAEAAEHLDLDEIPLVLLRRALDANPKDPDVNRLCAIALRQREQFDQAVACWERVKLARPNDEEATRMLGELAVEKTIHKGGYTDAGSSRDVMAQKKAGPQPGVRELSPEERLERQIAKKPGELPPYLELAELHVRLERYQEAESILARAYEVSGHDVDVREKLEDAQLRHLRQRLSDAEKEFQKTGNDQTKLHYGELRKQLNEKELDVYINRCERYPNSLPFKYELGLRYQLAKRYNEAIQQFQSARNDPRRKGACLLHLGQCFERIRQFSLAMSHYDAAVAEIADRDAGEKKVALYLAGKLAMQLEDVDAADRHLSALAGMDFAYKDVSALLDKVAELRKNRGLQ